MRRWLVLVAAATTGMVVTAFVVPLALLVRTLAEERALTSARQVAAALAPTLGDEHAARVDDAVAITAARTDGEVTVVLPDGRTVGEGDIAPDVLTRAAGGEAFTVAGDHATLVVTPVTGEAGTSIVQVTVPEARIRSGVRESWVVLGGLGAMLVAGAVVVADRLARRVVRPADEVAAAARALAGGDRTARAPVEGPPEIADVARALNGLADRIDDLLSAEREAAADLSHRLRTPMTALRLDVEALGPHPGAARIAADVAALEHAVDRVIRAARAEGRQAAGADLGVVVAARVAFWAPLAEDEGRIVDVDVPDHPIHVDASPDDLAAVIDVLVGNVLHHTPTGTAFSVRVVAADGVATLRVCDHGPGFPDHDVLARGVSGAGSTGLGLDIARRVAEEAGGALTLAAAPDGGACVDVRLPELGPR
jgi:signal transduction histidine kinase